MIREFEPRYHTIEQALRQRIKALPAHAPLPSEAELCTEFGVSRMTARGAVTRLVTDGLVYRESGRGTFVAPPSSNRRADVLVRFSDEMRRRGRVPTYRLLVGRTRTATSDEAEQLRLDAMGQVVEVRRVLHADGIPVALDAAVLPGSLAAVLETDLATSSLHGALEGMGRVPTRGHATVIAASATPEEAELLGVPPNSALLVERRLILDQCGRPLERTESRYVGDRYPLDVTFEVERRIGSRLHDGTAGPMAPDDDRVSAELERVSPDEGRR
jgi:GntR family transcriptional regulator